ncbi:MAG: LysE family translocator [Shimia sp.]
MNVALYLFVFAGLFSPGPNVILLTASGARFGLRPTLPHLTGVAAGVGVTAGLTGLGLGALLLAAPALTLVLKIVAAAWILMLAVRLWRSSAPEMRGAERPWSFAQAVLFQWVNPKVWAVALAASAYVADAGPVTAGVTLGTAFAAINLGVCLFWTSAGAGLATLLRDPQRWRLFIRAMALFLGVSAFLVLL